MLCCFQTRNHILEREFKVKNLFIFCPPTQSSSFMCSILPTKYSRYQSSTFFKFLNHLSIFNHVICGYSLFLNFFYFWFFFVLVFFSRRKGVALGLLLVSSNFNSLSISAILLIHYLTDYLSFLYWVANSLP